MSPTYSAQRFSLNEIFLWPALYGCHDPLTFGNLLPPQALCDMNTKQLSTVCILISPKKN